MAKVYIVETPVENFCGVGAGGVQFAYGKAEVNEGWVLNWFKKHGYKVTEKPADRPAADPLSGMTKDNLKAYAAEHGIDLTDVPDKKEAILTAIKAAESK